MFKDFTLRKKLTLAFSLIVFLLVGSSLYQVYSIRHLDTIFTNLVNEDFARLGALENIALSSAKLRDVRVQYQQEVALGPVTKTAAVQKADVTVQADNVRNATQAYVALTKLDNPYVAQVTIDKIVATSNTIITGTLATVNGKSDTTTQASLRNAHAAIDQEIAVARSNDSKGVTIEGNDVHKTIIDVLIAVMALAGLVTMLSIVLGTVVSASISRSLGKLRDGAERLANGDFSQAVAVKTNDEIGQVGNAFNQMAERLKESYKRLALEGQRDSAMLDGMGEGLIATDETGKIAVVNRVAASLLGFANEKEPVGKPIQDTYQLFDINDKDEKPLPQDLRPTFIVLNTKHQYEGLYGFHASNNEKRQLSISASPVTLEGELVGVVTILRDVTKEKEIDRMKTEFISLASHQLRTPLSAIKWFSEMLIAGDAGELQPDQMDFAKNIADSTERMIALVNALLNISRIESGRIMIDPKPTDLHELVAGIINDLKAKTEEKQQTLIISVHDDLPKINLDPHLIGQVYLNLLTNAIKYTPKGGEISVFISRKDDDIISQVTDNGYGIPKEQQDRIFQKFFRASNAVKVETDGTGLGLYLIKAIIESSGGKIWYKSEEGKGTTFWFSISVNGMKPKEGEVTLDA